MDIKTTNKNLLFFRIAFYAFGLLAFVSILFYQDQIAGVLAQTTGTDDVDVTAVVEDPNANTGGGSQTGSTPIGSSVRISGVAFPGAKLTLLKDGQTATTLIANDDGSFVIVVNSLTYGNYQFSVFAEDRDGVVSSPYVVNVPVYEVKSYQFNNVIIPPTINTSTTAVGSGQSVVVFGYAPAGSTVFIDVPGRFNLGMTIADASGFYRFEVRDQLAPGLYDFRSRAQVGATQSMYSRPVFITYFSGTTPPPVVPPQYASCVDYNRDRRVNLIDFSILLYWFGKDRPPSEVDCNGDARIDIKDFSILMYFWTG